MSEDRSEPARISRAYLRFAEVKARGRSSLYETLARGVAADPEIIAFLAALPKEKRSRTSCWLPCVTVAVRRAAGMTAVPQIVWWAGLDLNPLDVSDPEQAAWLRTLGWPEQTDRLARLCAAIQITASNKPRLVTGDLRHALATLAAEAPKAATLVIFHSAVLAYVAAASERAEFARSVRSRCHFWLANEAPQVFPEIASRIGETMSPGRSFVSVNGPPVAWADPHGASVTWIADPPVTAERLRISRTLTRPNTDCVSEREGHKLRETRRRPT